MNQKKELNIIEKSIKSINKEIEQQQNIIYDIIKPINPTFTDFIIEVDTDYNEQIYIQFSINNKKTDNTGSIIMNADNCDSFRFQLTLDKIYSPFNNILTDENYEVAECHNTSSTALFNIGKDIKNNINKYRPIIKEIHELQIKKTQLDIKKSAIKDDMENNKNEIFLNDIFDRFGKTSKTDVDDIMTNDNLSLYYITASIKNTDELFYVKFEKSLIECNFRHGRTRIYKKDGKQISKVNFEKEISNSIIIDNKLATDFIFLENTLGIPSTKTKKTIHILHDDFYELLEKKESVKSFIKSKTHEEITSKRTRGKLSKMGLYGF